MWDSPMYAMNMFYNHWLIKKMPLAYDRAECSQVGNQKRDTERLGRAKETPCSCQQRKMSEHYG